MPTPSSPRTARILIPEKISPDGLTLLSDFDVTQASLSPAELLAQIGGYDALVVRSETKVTAEVLRAGRNLKVVARAGVGVDNVDVAEATRLGVVVVNSPTGNIVAAAEHTIALMLATARNVGEACASLKAGKWERSRLVGVEMQGKTLGIIGLGKVGLTVARAARGMGMSLKAYDPYANTALASAADVTLVDSLAALLPVSDFLTIHTPLIASTKGMIGAPELARMKPTARILNVARGGMIDEAALLAALEAGALAGAGIDVFTAEPPVPGDTASALIAHPRVVATPHLGASTREAQENVSVDVCEQVALILGGQLPRSAVNAPIILPEEYRTLQPFVGLIEKMGSLYTQHYSSGRTLRGGAPASASASVSASTFELSYEGQLAGLGSTKPLFAGLVKGLLAPILSASVNINVVNAELVARERGILVNEQRSRETRAEGYSSYVTLRVRRRRRSSAATPSSSPSMKRAAPAAAAAATAAPPGPGKQGAAAGGGAAEPDDEERVIAGFVAGNIPYISRLGRFHTRFVPAGNLLICRNYDEPGKIGKVGGILGANGVNIESMTVAPPRMMQGEGEDEDGSEGQSGARRAGGGSGEALMILGVDRPVSKDVIDVLVAEQGVTEASVVAL